MIQMIAKTDFYYNKANVKRGTKFNALAMDANLLQVIGKAEFDAAPPVTKMLQLTKDEIAEEFPPIVKTKRKAASKGRYKRRDLTAED